MPGLPPWPPGLRARLTWLACTDQFARTPCCQTGQTRKSSDTPTPSSLSDRRETSEMNLLTWQLNERAETLRRTARGGSAEPATEPTSDVRTPGRPPPRHGAGAGGETARTRVTPSSDQQVVCGRLEGGGARGTRHGNKPAGPVLWSRRGDGCTSPGTQVKGGAARRRTVREGRVLCVCWKTRRHTWAGRELGVGAAKRRVGVSCV
jgi:hypothetical protein